MSSISKKEDPRITRTRNLILESFGQLLTKKGFETITIQDPQGPDQPGHFLCAL